MCTRYRRWRPLNFTIKMRTASNLSPHKTPPSQILIWRMVGWLWAYDCLGHGIVLDKLEKYGIRGGAALGWFKSYLKNRKQVVKIYKNNEEGRSVEITSNI